SASGRLVRFSFGLLIALISLAAAPPPLRAGSGDDCKKATIKDCDNPAWLKKCGKAGENSCRLAKQLGGQLQSGKQQSRKALLPDTLGGQVKTSLAIPGKSLDGKVRVPATGPAPLPTLGKTAG